MEFIEDTLAKCKKSDKEDFVSILLAMIFFFTILPMIVILFYGSKWLFLVFFLGGFLIPTTGYLLGMKLGKMLFKTKKVDFNKTKLYKKLEKEGCLYEFVDTINKEINKKNTIKYYNDILGIGLLVTETWFVFIDTSNPKFVKTNEIVKMSEELSSNSKFFLCLELKNKKYMMINRLRYDEIKNEIKTKFPNIIIE